MIREDEYDDRELWHERESCEACAGSGEENRCIDDMCNGQDECIHGDGMIACRACNGTGYVQEGRE